MRMTKSQMQSKFSTTLKADAIEVEHTTVVIFSSASERQLRETDFRTDRPKGDGSIDILGDKGHRYKRAVLGFSIVLIVLSLLPSLDYDGLSLFGIKPALSDVHGKRIVFSALWLELAYHAFFLALHRLVSCNRLGVIA
jgi:hypothetical protein